MQTSRIVTLVVVAAILGAGVWGALRPKGEPETSPPPTPAPAGAGGPKPITDPGWRPENPAGAPAGQSPSRPKDIEDRLRADFEAAKLPQISDAGTPATKGTKSKAVAGWRRGAKNRLRFEIADGIRTYERGSGQGSLRRYTFGVHLDIDEDLPNGGAKVTLTKDWFRFQVLQSTGFPNEFDSRAPDPNMLSDIAFRRVLDPELAILGRPLVIVLAPDGGIADIDNVKDWRERWFDAVERCEPGKGRLAPDVPTKAKLIAEWAEYLFPPLGGADVESGKPAAWTASQPSPSDWRVHWKGAISLVRHDPDAMRFDVVAKAEALRDPGSASLADPKIAKVFAGGLDDAWKSRWRFGRGAEGGPAGGLLEGQIDLNWVLWVSHFAGTDASGAQQYNAPYYEIERHVLVRRTSEE